ncbi:hypothetical protein TNCV_2967641 [Trichonephila clavipes]|nr:hypothetical protein TNCV_2967641 [Trichonephila clavipes]
MSSFLRFFEGDTRNRWRDGQVCPNVDKELWRLGPDGSGVFWRRTSVSRCGQGTMAPWARRLGCVLACYAPIGRGRKKEKRGEKKKKRNSGRETDGRRRREKRRKSRDKGQESPGEDRREVGRGGRVESGRENGRKEEEERRKRERGDGKRVGERESEARLEWRKGLSPEIGGKKTMNAAGVENGTMN